MQGNVQQNLCYAKDHKSKPHHISHSGWDFPVTLTDDITILIIKKKIKNKKNKIKNAQKST